MSPVSTPVFGFSTPKGASSSTNDLEGGSSVAEKVKKTLALLEQYGSKNSTTMENIDSTYESSPRISRNVIPLKINLRDNTCYSRASPMIMQTMVTAASFPEEQLANLTKLVEGLTTHVQHQESRIDKLMDKMEGILDGMRAMQLERVLNFKKLKILLTKLHLLNRCHFLMKERSHSIA